MGCCWSSESITNNIKSNEEKIIIDVVEINHGMSSNVFKSMTLESDMLICKKVKKRYKPLALKEIEILKKIKTLNSDKFPTYFSSKILIHTINIYTLDIGAKDLFKYVDNNTTLLNYEIKSIAMQMLNCIKEFHKLGYLHLDIKLENFVITSNMHVLLIDFGAAQKKPENNSLCYARGPIGTKDYAPYEVCYYKYHITSDYWSWGVCYWILLTRSMPFLMPKNRKRLKKAFKFPNDYSSGRYNRLDKKNKKLFKGLFKGYKKRFNIEDIEKVFN
tara:strand:+ start:1518 stop:2339 length:822 start_codon:yes stop_codon:yes gene_type:complete